MSAHCAPVRALLVSARRGEATPLQHALVSQHLAHCEACAAVDDVLGKGLSAVAARQQDDDEIRRLLALAPLTSASSEAASEASSSPSSSPSSPAPASHDPPALVPAPWRRRLRVGLVVGGVAAGLAVIAVVGADRRSSVMPEVSASADPAVTTSSSPSGGSAVAAPAAPAPGLTPLVSAVPSLSAAIAVAPVAAMAPVAAVAPVSASSPASSPAAAPATSPMTPPAPSTAASPVPARVAFERLEPSPHLRMLTSPAWSGGFARIDPVDVRLRLAAGTVAVALTPGDGRRVTLETIHGEVVLVGGRVVVDVDAAGAVVLGEGSVELVTQQGRRRLPAGTTGHLGVSVREAPPAALLADGYLTALPSPARRSSSSSTPTASGAKPAGLRPGAAATGRVVATKGTPGIAASPPATSAGRTTTARLVEELTRAEAAARLGDLAAADAVYEALRAGTVDPSQRALVDFEQARLHARRGDDGARRTLQRLAASGTAVSVEAALAVCELDVATAPCAALRCLEPWMAADGPARAGALRLEQRGHLRARCGP
jgi:hypothetical protein